MTTPIGKFRETMAKLLVKLEEWAQGNIQQEMELDKFKMKFNMGMKVNPRGSIEFFVTAIEPYADHILTGDDEYFLGAHIEVEDEYNGLSQQLKQWWPQLAEHQKNYVKKTFQLLLMQAAIATSHQGLRKVINRYRSADNQLNY
jgi:hypothetical protein